MGTSDTKTTVSEKTSVAKATKAISKKTVKKDEFRTNKRNGHPSYIYEKRGNRYRYIGITHSPITSGVKNIELEQNPNPKDSNKAYMRTKTSVDKEKNFKDKKKGYYFVNEDEKKVKRIIRKNKKSEK